MGKAKPQKNGKQKKKTKTTDSRHTGGKKLGSTGTGKISKPQKSGKHKKMKAIDPFYTGARKLDRDSGGFNMEPKHQDEQGIPRSLQEIMKLKKEVSAGMHQKRKKKKKVGGYDDESWVDLPVVERGMSRPLRHVPKFVPGKKEKERDFMRRIERETQAVIMRSKMEDKYKIKIDQGPGGQMEVQNVKKNKNKKNQQRLKEKKGRKKEKIQQLKDNRKTGFEQFKDEVEFGEVAMQPPELVARPRKSNPSSGKPGGKHLLLKDMLEKRQTAEKLHSSQRQLGQSVKRKYLAPVRQRIMDEERDRAIDLYREMKSRKQTV